MSVDETVREALLSYPSLLRTRADVLHFLFCVLGNGYEWVDGALEESSPGPGVSVRERAGSQLAAAYARYHRDGGDELAKIRLQIAVELYDAEITRIEQAEAEIEERVRSLGALHGPPYPYCDQLPIDNLPADITPEWAAAAEEIRAIVQPLWDQGIDQRTSTAVWPPLP